MKRFRPLSLLTATTLLLLTGAMSVSQAQPFDDPMFDGGPLFDEGPGGHRPPPGGGMRGPGAGAKGRLDGFMHGLERLKGSSNDVSKAQAQKMIALLKPWSAKATMSDAEAHKLAIGLEAVLTSAQKPKFGPPRRGGFPGGPDRGQEFGPPPDRDGGPPPDGNFGPPNGDFGPPDGDFGPPPGGEPRGERGQRGRDIPESFNPFYAPTGRSDWKKLPSSTQQLLARRYRENRAVLERLSRRTKI